MESQLSRFKTYEILRGSLDENQPSRESDSGRIPQAEDHNPGDALPSGPVANGTDGGIHGRHKDCAGCYGLWELLGSGNNGRGRGS